MAVTSAPGKCGMGKGKREQGRDGMSRFGSGSFPQGTAERLLHALKDLLGFRHPKCGSPVGSWPLWQGLGSFRAPVAHPGLAVLLPQDLLAE